MEGQFFVDPRMVARPEEQEQLSGCYTFRDFCPLLRRKEDGWFFEADYETTSQLLSRANEWTRCNPKWQVKNCESTAYDANSGFLVTATTFPGQQLKRNLRCLRLWLAPRLTKNSQPFLIKCINVIPRLESSREISTGKENPTTTAEPVFERLPQMLARVNELLLNKPINGRILNVETLCAPVDGTWTIDTERSTVLTDDEAQKRSFVHFLRIYYEYGNQLNEQLELVDFVPKQYFYELPMPVVNFEAFSSLLRQAAVWLSEQEPGTRYISTNFVQIPLASQDGLDGNRQSPDSEQMYYSAVRSEFALRFIRIAYSKPSQFGPEKYFPTLRDPVLFNCKIFVPSSSAALGSAELQYEDLFSVKRKMEAWLQTTGVKIIGSQSTVVKLPYAASSLIASVDSCITPRDTYSGRWLIVYYIFLDGHYLEPPANLLPSGECSSIARNAQTLCSIQ